MASHLELAYCPELDELKEIEKSIKYMNIRNPTDIHKYSTHIRASIHEPRSVVDAVEGSVIRERERVIDGEIR